MAHLHWCGISSIAELIRLLLGVQVRSASFGGHATESTPESNSEGALSMGTAHVKPAREALGTAYTPDLALETAKEHGRVEGVDLDVATFAMA